MDALGKIIPSCGTILDISSIAIAVLDRVKHSFHSVDVTKSQITSTIFAPFLSILLAKPVHPGLAGR